MCDTYTRFSESTINNPKFVAAGAVIANPAHFDPDFFGIGHKEAELMDPQHRLFMMCAWEALESAGYPCLFLLYHFYFILTVPIYLGRDSTNNIGVWASASFNTYLVNNLLPQGDIMNSPSDYMKYLVTNDKDYLASRVAYHLNLNGPAVVVQSACSRYALS